MKKVLSIALLLLVVAGMAYGQDNKWRDNNLGLVFLFSGLDNTMLINYNGGFGAKIAFGPVAIRPVIIFAMAGTKEQEQTVPAPVSPYWVSDETSMSVFGFGASFLFHLATGRISPYIGAGAIVDFGSTKTTPGHLDTDTVDIQSMSQFGFAAHMCIGGEFFLVRNLSFSAEYRLGYGMSKTTQKMDFADPTWDDFESAGSMHGLGLVSSTFLILTLYII